MNSTDQLLIKGIGKKYVLELAAGAVKDEAFFVELLQAIRHGERTPSMKASWIIGATVAIDKNFVQKYSGEILVLLMRSDTGGVQRELMKVLMEVSLSEEDYGKFLDLCFKLLTQSHSDVAVKYNAIRVIERSMKKYPEMKNEFIGILEGQLETFTDAGKRYVARLLVKLRK